MNGLRHLCVGWHFLCLLVIALMASALQPAFAEEPVRIAVLAFRPKPQTLKQWQPLVQVLKVAIPERDFVLQAYTLDELNSVVANQQVDFVLTNSGHYVLLTRRSGLKAPLATLLVNENGQETSTFGGVIFARSGRNDLTTLASVKGKTISSVSKDSLGGYQLQAFELLQAGVDVEHDAQVVFPGMPQDKVVQDVLSGHADVGFVRTGVLEALAREGTLDLSRVTILNTKSLRSFPVQSSTMLYPEWPFSYLGHVDEHLARQVTAALFSIKADSAAALAIGIRGFSVPADYTSVVELLKALRMPPFDAAPAFTWRDVVLRYKVQIFLAGVALTLIMLLSLRLWFAGRQLRMRQQQVLRQQQALEEEVVARKASEIAIDRARSLLLNVIDNIPVRVFWKGLDLHFLGCNSLFARDSGRVNPQDVIGQDDFAMPWFEQANAYRTDDAAVMRSGQATLFYEEQQTTLTGQTIWLRTSKVPLRDQDNQIYGMLGVYEDVTEQKFAEKKLQLAAGVFRHAREGIVITEATGNIIEVNAAFSLITGYSHEEVIGKNPRILNSGRQDTAFYTAMFVDLQAKDHWSGEVWNRRKNGEVYAEMLTISTVRDKQGAISHYVAMFFDISALKEHQRQLEHIAHFDALTSLPNRVLLADRLRQAMVQAQRRGQLLAVAYLDLDGFKVINDTYGHDAGDQLLIAVSASMKGALREGDTLARLGGDEFVAVLSDMSDANACAVTLTRLLAAAGQSTQVEQNQLQVTASLGVTFFPQADSVDADQLMRQADQAMYQAKVSGKNRYHVFDAAQDRSVRGLHESLDEIAGAIAREEFVLHYQPKVNLRTGEVVGAEALIRWQHPVKGLLSPAHFLPVIEDHALGVQLGDWVIHAALQQLTQWRAQGLALPVSVNVSAHQFAHESFVEKLSDALLQHSTVAGLLEMEVLETSAMQDLNRTAKVIGACVALGVSFALDDFGTGYSSLTYLKHLPVTLIKIDQSFVRDMLEDADDRAILEGIIGLARAFHRGVIAEGAETIAHGTLLLQLGCELAQGYGIARPMPAEQFPAWVATWQPYPAWTATNLP